MLKASVNHCSSTQLPIAWSPDRVLNGMSRSAVRSCELLPHLHNITHTMNASIPFQGESGEGCGPTKFGALSILYFDKSGNIILGRLKDFVVEECGCRP